MLQNCCRIYTEMLLFQLLPTLFTHLLQGMTLVELHSTFSLVVVDFGDVSLDKKNALEALESLL